MTHSGPVEVAWQPAPGNTAVLGQDLNTAMAFQNPRLREVALALGGRGAIRAHFAAMWRLIDTVGQSIEPAPLRTDSDLSVLVGRPIAIVAAALRLELKGTAFLDLGWDQMGNDSDAALTKVQFPVIVGDLAKLSDGLIGFYRQAEPGGGYDLSTFYSQGADPASTSGIIRPAQDTLVLRPSPPLDPDGEHEPPDLTPVTQRVLMLADPRAPVHATTGILPTASLALPPDQGQATASVLDLSLFAAPVLRGATGLAIPVPAEGGYAVSYAEIDHDKQGHLDWMITRDITDPSGQAVWAYSPQQVREGWLRFNPVVLEFALANAAGQPLVRDGEPNTLTLTVTNRAQRTVTFQPGRPPARASRARARCSTCTSARWLPRTRCRGSPSARRAGSFSCSPAPPTGRTGPRPRTARSRWPRAGGCRLPLPPLYPFAASQAEVLAITTGLTALTTASTPTRSLSTGSRRRPAARPCCSNC